ncbi:8460_t:CDS:2, partial [Gigaspora margarita]
KVRKKYLELFTNGHSLATALYTYKDSIYIRVSNDQELVQLLANSAQNPDYGYVLNLFKQYRNEHLGGQNVYDLQSENVFILYIVTNLISRIHEKIRQSGELCYVDTSASFKLLNTSITLFYTSCITGTLPLGLIVISDKLAITLKKEFNLLKQLLPPYAFFGRGPDIAKIQQSKIDSEYLVPSQEHGHISKDHSFYASLHFYTSNEGHKYSIALNNISHSSNKTQETEELNVNLTIQ